MQSRRRIRTMLLCLLCLSVFASLFLIIGIVFFSAPISRQRLVTREKFEMIQLGMTIEDVERIMGLPQHDKLEPENFDWPDVIDLNFPTAVFADEYAMIVVSANERGVYAKKFGTRRQTSWLDYLNGILGW